MAWLQILIDTKAEYADLFSDALTEFDALSVTFEDAKDTPMYEPKPGEVMLWPDTRVIGLFDDTPAINDIFKAIQSLDVPLNAFSCQLARLEDQDWTRAWMEDFHPMQFGQRLWICPSWRAPEDPDAVNILLDPGLAFGTGTHPTTALCLEWLDSQDMIGKTIIDYGCGSGILAIAALKLGARHADAVDIDPQAITASIDNAKKNHVEDRLRASLVDETPLSPSDIVIANILAGPLKELKPILSQLCCDNGLIALSGILQEQAQDLAEFYSDTFIINSIEYKGEWARIIGAKPIKSSDL